MDIGTGYVIAASITAGPSSIAAWAALRVKRDQRTNHGKKIGEHVEDLVDWAANTTVAMQLHQESDNDLRQALGLPRTQVIFPRIPGDSREQTIDARSEVREDEALATALPSDPPDGNRSSDSSSDALAAGHSSRHRNR